MCWVARKLLRGSHDQGQKGSAKYKRLKPPCLSPEGQEWDSGGEDEQGANQGCKQPERSGAPSCLPAPYTLQALLIQHQEHWLKKPRDKQKLKIWVPVAVI